MATYSSVKILAEVIKQRSASLNAEREVSAGTFIADPLAVTGFCSG